MASNSDEYEPKNKKSKTQNITQSEQSFNNFMNPKVEGGGTVEIHDINVIGQQINNFTRNNYTSAPAAHAPTAREEDFLEEETNDLSEKLKITYKNIKLPNVPWMDEGNLLLGSYYVDLKLHAEETEDKKRSISSEEIFHDIAPSSQGSTGIVKQEKAPKRILISAPPGYGKTTLAHKIIYDWAHQHKEYVKPFKLAFLIKLRNLEQNIQSEIADIAESCGFENMDAVSKIVSRNASSTLLILDGLDKLKSRERINVYKVLFRSVLSNVTVVTTCRTGGYTITQEDKDNLFKGIEKSTEFQDRKITIEGLNVSNREKLLRMCVKSPDKSGVINRIREIIAETANNHEKRQLFECPLFVILLAFIVEEKSDVVIETKTDLYKCLIDCVIRRSCCKNGTQLPSDFTVFDTKEAWNDYRNVVYKFGNLSHEALVDDGSLHFNCCKDTDVIYEMGFLIKQCDVSNFSKRYYYEVFHLSIMEFVSAYFMWLEFKNNYSMFKSEIFLKIICLFDDDKSSSLIVPFLFGLLGDELSVLINNLIPYSITFCKTYSKAHYFSDCKCVQNLPDSIHVLFPKVIESGEWLLTQTQLLNKLLPLKRLKFSNDITAKDFVNLSHGVAINYLEIEINSPFNCDVPMNFDYTKIWCKKLKFSIKSDAENIEIWLQIFNSITATETKKLKFSGYCNYQHLDWPKINEILATVTKTPKNCQIMLKCNVVDHYITNYTNVTKVVMNSSSPLPAIPKNILTAMSASANLQTVCIYYYENELDISLLTNCGKKQWDSVTLERVKTVYCSSELVNDKCVLSFQNINCGNKTTLFESIVPDLLHCDDGYIIEAVKSRSFLARWRSVKELSLYIFEIVSHTDVMSCLKSLCLIHTPTIRLRLFTSPWGNYHLNGEDCAGIYNEHTVVDFMKSINVTEAYISHYPILTYHGKTCLLKPFARTICENQITVNTIIFSYYEECIADACTCLSRGFVDKVVVVFYPQCLPNVDVVSRIDFTKFKIQYGYLSDFLRKTVRVKISGDRCICINLMQF